MKKPVVIICLFLYAVILGGCSMINVSEQQDAKTLGAGKHTFEISLPYSPTVNSFHATDTLTDHSYIPPIIPLEFHWQYGLATHHDIGLSLWTSALPFLVMTGGTYGFDIGTRLNWKWMVTETDSHHKLAVNTSFAYYHARGKKHREDNTGSYFKANSGFAGIALIYSYHPRNNNIQSFYVGIKPMVFTYTGIVDSVLNDPFISAKFRHADDQSDYPMVSINATLTTISPFIGAKLSDSLSLYSIVGIKSIEFMPTFGLHDGKAQIIGFSVACGFALL